MATSFYLDPSSGQLVPFDPNAAGAPYQSELDTLKSNQLLQQAQTGQQQEVSAQTGQTALVNQLGQVIAGTAPSVAQTQLAQGVGQIRQQEQSQAGSVAGPNSAFANYGAMIQAGAAQAAANQQAAQLRAGEAAQARTTQGQVLNQQATEGNQQYATGVSGSQGFAGSGTQAGTAQSNIDEEKEQGWKNFGANVISGLGSAAIKGALS